MFVAGRMIPGGETQHFTLAELPAHLRPAPVVPAVEAVDEFLTVFCSGPVKAIVAAVPGLSDEDLARLEAFETGVAGKARGTVARAIAAEKMRRAGAKADGRGHSTP